MIKAAICGGSGYAGGELLRILFLHPDVDVTAVTSERSAGKEVRSLFPHLNGFYDGLEYEPLDREALADKADVFFMALPHAASQEAVDYFYKQGKAVIDLSADYRLKDPKVYEAWYKTPHNFKGTLKKAVYGLPEIFRAGIKKATLVANPGCYPTGALLGLYPLAKKGLIKTGSVVVDSKSGTSGAGRKSDTAFSFCEVNEAFRAYGIGVHRHTPEIEQGLNAVTGGKDRVTFTPHLVPIDRGILSVIYMKLMKETDAEGLTAIYKKAYAREPFVRVLSSGGYPNVKNVKGTNICEIGCFYVERTKTAIVVTAIDNLGKGAAGQAVHNMNLITGLEETTALLAPAVFP